MDIILLEDIPKLGDMGEIVDVKPGYARNYLIPQKLALRASTNNISQLTHQKTMIEARKSRMLQEAQEILGSLDKVSVTIERKTGDGDRLFGSVTNRDIATALLALDLEIDSKKILLDNPLKELGITEIRIKLHAHIHATVRVWVIAA